MILVPRYPRLILGETVEQALHAWETRPWAQERVDDKVMRAAFFERILAGLHPLADHFPWKRRTRRDRIGHPLMMSGPQQALLGLGGESGDPNFSSVTLLMHMDDTGLTDVKGNTVTINGTVARSSTQSKFGGFSADFGTAVSGNYLSLPQVAGYDLGSTSWTFEGFIYMTATTGDQQWMHYGKDTVVTTNDISYGMGTFTTSGIGLRCFVYVGTTSTTRDFSMPSANAWHHWHASINSSGNFFSGLDGTNLGSGGNPGTPNTPTGRTLKLGRYHSGDNRPVRGYQDEIRLTKDFCRYTVGASYTVPTAAFPSS